MLEQTLTVVLVLVLLAINAMGVVLVALQLPGTWLMMVATALFAWWSAAWHAEAMIGLWGLITLLGLAVLGEVVEFLGGVAGSTKEGGSKRAGALAILGGIIGALLGTVLIPVMVIGTLIGAGLGAGIGSLAGEQWAGSDWGRAWKVGQGAAVGRVLGSVAKLVVAVGMWLAATGFVLWP